MKDEYDVDALCVEVFSKISATVTHEIKNTLSIINENAGFLNDLAMMAGDEGSVPSQRVYDATESIARQVTRSNAIMKNLNRFSHSGDVPVSQANLLELLQLMAALTSRQANSKSVKVSLNCSGEITITTCLLPLGALFFYILDTLYDAVNPGANICIEAIAIEGEVQVSFVGQEGLNHNNLDKYLSWEKEQKLVQVLEGTFRKSPDAIVITFACNKSVK